MSLINFIPRVSKRYLLLIAALVWTFAGSMLLFRGYAMTNPFPVHWVMRFGLCIIAGLLFYRLMFDKISSKHVLRIRNLAIEQPGVFSFFNGRSYIMMFSMITLGITLRKSGIVAPEYLSLMYITMGVPLLLSSVRFYSNFLKY